MMRCDIMWYVGGELYHHGIKGQKWGLRRYQNPDGSYTEEGRRRYFSDKYGAEYGSKEAKKKYLKDYNNYISDRDREMANAHYSMHGYTKTDALKKLREKYGPIEFDSFEKTRAAHKSLGKTLIAGAAITALTATAAIAYGLNKKQSSEKLKSMAETNAFPSIKPMRSIFEPDEPDRPDPHKRYNQSFEDMEKDHTKEFMRDISKPLVDWAKREENLKRLNPRR